VTGKKIGKMYDSPHQFEPLLLSDRNAAELQPLMERIVQGSLRLTATAHWTTRATLRELVRQMNSYYSNRIEGQSTHPVNIARALQNNFSDKPDVAKLQRIALAHIEAERQLEANLANYTALSSAFLIEAHRAMYSRLPAEDRLSDDGRPIEPGRIREEDVKVGRHVPPAHATIPLFLARLDERYARTHGWERLLLAAACAHHRVAWVHPFVDGNGRATRLQSHCVLWTLSEGLWSPSPGFARTVDRYYARLQDADQPRQGDLDGRGNLSERGLLAWITYFLETCDDQVTYMSDMLDLDNFKQRLEALIIFRSTQDSAYRREAILPLLHVFALGPVSRGEFSQMTGLKERTARSLMSRLLDAGLLVSDQPKGPVRMGLPIDALGMLFPRLYPEVEMPLG
jgi:Fic family protein